MAGQRLDGAEIDNLLQIPYRDPPNGEAAMYALSFARVRRRDAPRVVRSLLAILEDKGLAPLVRAQAPEGISCHMPEKQPGLRRSAVAAFRRHLKDGAPEVRFWSAFGLSLLNARQARGDLRILTCDTTQVEGFWTVGEEASDAIDVIEGRNPPDRRF